MCLSKLSAHAGYLTINISSPNTGGLRDFHDEIEFEKLLEGINKIKKDKNIPKPILVKLSPDINYKEISKIIELILRYKIEGVIVSNTTDSNRDNLLDEQKKKRRAIRPTLKKYLNRAYKKILQETKGK